MNKKTVMIAVLAVAVIAIAATFAAIGNGSGKDDYVAPKDTRLWIFGNANTVRTSTRHPHSVVWTS